MIRILREQEAGAKTADERRRFGYRRLGLLLPREGLTPNHKTLRRLYVEERFQVRTRGGRKRALGTLAPMALPQAANQRWSLVFVSDTLTGGRRFRVLCVVDNFTRECRALVADTSLSGDLPLKFASKFTNPSLFASELSADMAAREKRASIPWASLRRWLEKIEAIDVDGAIPAASGSPLGIKVTRYNAAR